MKPLARASHPRAPRRWLSLQLTLWLVRPHLLSMPQRSTPQPELVSAHIQHCPTHSKVDFWAWQEVMDRITGGGSAPEVWALATALVSAADEHTLGCVEAPVDTAITIFIISSLVLTWKEIKVRQLLLIGVGGEIIMATRCTHITITVSNIRSVSMTQEAQP